LKAIAACRCCFFSRIIGFCHFTVIKFFVFLFLSSIIVVRLLLKQQEQAAAAKQTQQQQQQQPQPVCSNKSLSIATDRRILLNDVAAAAIDDNEKDDNELNYDSTSGESDDAESVEIWSHELPVWIKGEQRWISGVTEATTCLDLIEALLIDEGVIKQSTASADDNNNSAINMYPTRVNDYVIIERWRRVEQVLDGRTRILKIWTAWGTEQAEVSITIHHKPIT